MSHNDVIKSNLLNSISVSYMYMMYTILEHVLPGPDAKPTPHIQYSPLVNTQCIYMYMYAQHKKLVIFHMPSYIAYLFGY